MDVADNHEDQAPVEMSYFECACRSDDHLLKFQFDKDPKDPSLYTTIHLHQWQNPLKRILVAIKYVLGFKSKYGHWDCWEIDPVDVMRLRLLCQEYLALNEYGEIDENTFKVDKEVK